MADVPLLASQSIAAPLDYVIPGAQEIIPKSITASFDGSGAGGSFVPTLVILAPNGTVLAACPTDITVAAGASADVSWFPRVGGFASAGGAGIRFNYDNEGGYLDITTNNADPLSTGLSIHDKSGKGIVVQTEGIQGSIQLLTNGGGNIDIETLADGNVFVFTAGTGGIELSSTGSGGLNLHDDGNGGASLQSNGAGGLALYSTGGGGIFVSDDSGGIDASSTNGHVNVTAGSTLTLRSQGKTSVDSFGGVDVIDVGSGGLRFQTTAGQILIATAVGNNPIGIDGGYPILRNANSGGGVGTATIQDRLDTGDFYAVIDLAASATYFSVCQNGRVNMAHLPTSAAGLSAGDLWKNGTVVNIV